MTPNRRALENRTRRLGHRDPDQARARPAGSVGPPSLARADTFNLAVTPSITFTDAAARARRQQANTAVITMPTTTGARGSARRCRDVSSARAAGNDATRQTAVPSPAIINPVANNQQEKTLQFAGDLFQRCELALPPSCRERDRAPAILPPPAWRRAHDARFSAPASDRA